MVHNTYKRLGIAHRYAEHRGRKGKADLIADACQGRKVTGVILP